MKKIVHSRIDECGNEIRVYKDADRAPDVLELRLFIRAENKERKLGLISKQSRTLFINRDRTKHLHYKSNSYGFNYMLLNDAQAFDVVVLRDDVATYRVPREQLLKHGEFLYFKQQGFERQIFVTLAILDAFCIREKIF